MAVISRTGHTACGTSKVLVDGAVPPPLVGVTCGNPHFLDSDDQVIFQALLQLPALPHLRTFAPLPPVWGLWSWTIGDVAIFNVDRCGQNELFANGLVWAANLEPPPNVDPTAYPWGYRDSHGTHQPFWRAQAVDDQTGTIAVVLNGGTELWLWNGVTAQFVDGGALVAQMVFKGGILYYQVGGTFKAVNVAGTVAPPSQVPVAGVYMSPGVRLGYQDARGMLLFGWDATNALPLHAAGEPLEQDFYPDLQTLPDGTVKVITSKTSDDEQPQIYIVDTVAQTVNGSPRSWVSLVTPTPEPPDPEPPDPEPPDPNPEPEPEPPNPEPEPEPEPMPPANPLKPGKTADAYWEALARTISGPGPNFLMDFDSAKQGIRQTWDQLNAAHDWMNGNACVRGACSRQGQSSVIVDPLLWDRVSPIVRAIDLEYLQRG